MKMKMKWMQRFRIRLTGLTDAVTRFPLTSVFLLAATIVNAYMIGSREDYLVLLLTLLFGAFLGAVSEAVFERFYTRVSSRLLVMGVAVLLTVGYYFILRPAPISEMEVRTRTIMALFALFIAFIWVPVIKSKVSFNKSFMISFQTLIITLFFSGVIFAGTSLILLAVDQLLFTINGEAYSQTANIVFLLFAPMYFLSLIPNYHSINREDSTEYLERIEKLAAPPKFLRVLISNILIPLISVFTFILVVYIIQNISGEFWKDNLLEPMLVAYAITVILVYILASEIENKFTSFYRKFFPKILVPIVIFQIISSYITLTDTGLTHTRYFVLLFGLFGVLTGLLTSFLSVKKNGLIAALLIVFATISIIPPVDAFTLSKNSQIRTLEEVLVKNDMLENNKVSPNSSISSEDQKKITNAVYYLNMMSYTKELSYLPKDFNTYEDFHTTFGFEEYRDPEKFHVDRYTFVTIKYPPTPIQITGHDFFVQLDMSLNLEFPEDSVQYEINKENQSYTLIKDVSKDKVEIKLRNENKDDILTFSSEEILDKFADYQGENFITNEEATFIKENEEAKMTIFMQNLQIEKEQPYTAIMTYVFVQIK